MYDKRFFNLRPTASAHFIMQLKTSSKSYDRATQAQVYLTIVATFSISILGVIQTIVQSNGADKVRDQSLSALVIAIPIILGIAVLICYGSAKVAEGKIKEIVTQGVADGNFFDNAPLPTDNERNILARLGIS